MPGDSDSLSERKVYMKKSRKTIDLTKGHVLWQLLIFSVPMMIGSLFQDLYQIVDISISGHILGDNAVAAIGATTGIMMIINTSVRGLTVGNSLPMSAAFGAGDMEKTRKTYAGTIKIAVIVAAIITLILMAPIDPILMLVQTPINQYDDAKAYIMIVIGGIIAAMIYHMYEANFRALGNSKIPLMILIMCSLLNIALDYLCVAVLDWKVPGAAIATVVSWTISAVVSGILFYKMYPEMRIKWSDFKGDKEIIKDMLPIGLSSMATLSVFSLGAFMIQGAVNVLGKTSIVAKTAMQNINKFATIPSVSICNALATFCAQNYGAKKFKRIQSSVLWAMLASFVINIVTFTIIFFTGPWLIRVITDTESEEVVKQAYDMSVFVTAFVWAQTMIMGYRQAIQGMKRKIIPIIGTTIELFTRGFCAFYMIPAIGYMGIAYAEPLSWIVSGIVMVVSFYLILGKVKRTETAAD